MRSTLNLAAKLGHRRRLSHLVGAVVAVLSTVWLIQSASLIVLNIDRGFDIIDESYFLLAAKYPEDLAFWASRFGFYTGALLAAAGGDIGAFRLAANCVWFAHTLRGFPPSCRAEASRTATRFLHLHTRFLFSRFYPSNSVNAASTNSLSAGSMPKPGL